MSLDLLKERFGHSVKKEKDNREKIHEQLNGKFNSNSMDGLKDFKAQHQEELEQKDRVIENLEIEASKLANQVLTLERENSTIIEELNNSKWLENNIASNTKKIYEEKIRTMSIVDSTELIPMLIKVARKKQGNTKLNWGKWLEIPENKYLFQINKSLAKRVFDDTNNLIDEIIGNINRKRTRGGDVDVAANYFLSFTGNDEHNNWNGSEDSGQGRNDTARVDMVATQFTPNDPTNKGFDDDETSGRKPLAESGFTISYWWRPDESYSDSFPIGWKRDEHSRFSFGIKNASKPYWSLGTVEVKNTTWQDHFHNSGQGHLSGSLLHDQNANDGAGGAPGSGNHLMLGKWYHMVITYAGTDNVDGDGNMLRKVYLNGYHIYGGFGEGNQSVNWTSHTGAQMTQGLSFGMRAVVASGNHTDGLRHTKYNNGNACGLDEVAIYDEEKDATWVSSVYNGGTGYNHKDSGGDGLVAYWKFNEGTGDTVKDLSGYGWHGTLTNAGNGTKIDGTSGNYTTILGINERFPNAKPTWNDMADEDR